MNRLISIIIPCLNEELAIEETLARIDVLRGDRETIVSDGGSIDRTVEIAKKFGAVTVNGARGRGAQQRLAAEHAKGDVLWFLHADTLPGAEAIELIQTATEDPYIVGGNFRVRFSGDSVPARFTTACQPVFRAAGLIYGDSAIFVRRATYFSCGGFRELPLFEDIDLVKRIRRLGGCISA